PEGDGAVIDGESGAGEGAVAAGAAEDEAVQGHVAEGDGEDGGCVVGAGVGGGVVIAEHVGGKDGGAGGGIAFVGGGFGPVEPADKCDAAGQGKGDRPIGGRVDAGGDPDFAHAGDVE